MNETCPPPIPGQGMNITVSIDLSSMMGCPPPPSPSTSLTQAQPDRMTSFDPNLSSLIYFNENNRPKQPDNPCFGDVMDSLCGLSCPTEPKNSDKENRFGSEDDDSYIKSKNKSDDDNEEEDDQEKKSQP